MTPFTPTAAGAPPGADNNYLLRRILNVLLNGQPGLGPVEEDNTLLRQILAALEGQASVGGYNLPAAYSVAQLQALPTVGVVPFGAVVQVVGGTASGVLNNYQLQAGALPSNPPSYFPPNDDPAAHWMLLN